MKLLLRLIAATALFALWGGVAQAGQAFQGSWYAPAAPAYVGPADAAGATPVLFYGWRAMSAAIAAAGTQKLVNIKRASDSETCDFIVATTGGVGLSANCSGADNSETLATFLAATTGTLTKKYNQGSAGSGADISQATAGKQLTVTISCINSLPCSTGAGGQYLTGTSTNTSQPFTMSTVAIRTGVFTSFQIPWAGDGGSTEIEFNNSANQWSVFSGTRIASVANDSVWHTSSMAFNGASSLGQYDGVSTGTINPGAGAFGGQPSLGANAAGSFPITGSVLEDIEWASALSGTAQTALCQNQQAYYGAVNFGASC